MKKVMSIIFLAALISPLANAKSAAECKQELTMAASQYTNGNFLLKQKDGIPEIKDCKSIQYADQEKAIDSKIYLTQDGSALIVQDNRMKKLSYSLIPGIAKDHAVMAGRLIITTQDNRVFVVGRNGHILEMLTADGESYKAVKSLKVDNDSLVLTQEQSGEVTLTEEQVTKRVNEPGKYRAISF